MPDNISTGNEIHSGPMLSTAIETHYINSAEILTSPYDFVFVMSQLGEIKDGEPVFYPRTQIMMSPQHTKVFLDLLTEHVGIYESTFGKIPTLEDNKEAIRVATEKSKTGKDSD